MLKTKFDWQIFTVIIVFVFSIPSYYFNYKLINENNEVKYKRDIWESVHKVDRLHIDRLNKEIEDSKFWEKFTADRLGECHDKKLKIDKNGRSIK